MRKKKYENFIAKLMMTKDIIDAAELEKHTSVMLSAMISLRLKKNIFG